MASLMIARLIDSVIIIDHLNGVDAATQFLLGINPQQTSISVITWAEIMDGVEAANTDLVRSFLHQYKIFSIDQSIADLAAKTAKEIPLEIAGCISGSLGHPSSNTAHNQKHQRFRSSRTRVR